MPSKKKGKKEAAQVASDEKKESGAVKMDISEDVPKTKTGAVDAEGKTVNYPGFNLEAYLWPYTGQARLIRLQHVAKVCPEVRERAFKTLFAEIQTGLNIRMYEENVELARRFGVRVEEDQSWKGSSISTIATNQRKFEEDLQKARSHEQMFEQRSILVRQAHLYFQAGDYINAFSKYNEALQILGDSDEDNFQLHMEAVKSAIAMRQFAHIDKHYRQTNKFRSQKKYPVLEAQMSSAYGLWHLMAESSSDYISPARVFAQVSKHLGDSLNDVLSAKDVATYACLSSLASLPRNDIRRQLEDDTFRQLLEAAPEWTKILQAYLQSKYGEVFQKLEMMKKDFLMDPYLNKHVPRLFLLIRERAIMQYFKAFTIAKLPSMAEVMGQSVPELQTHLANLIGDGRIEARIDSANKIVYARSADQRNADYQKAMKTSDLLVRSMKTTLLKMSLARNDIVVKSNKSKTMRDGHDGSSPSSSAEMDLFRQMDTTMDT